VVMPIADSRSSPSRSPTRSGCRSVRERHRRQGFYRRVYTLPIRSPPLPACPHPRRGAASCRLILRTLWQHDIPTCQTATPMLTGEPLDAGGSPTRLADHLTPVPGSSGRRGPIPSPSAGNPARCLGSAGPAAGQSDQPAEPADRQGTIDGTDGSIAVGQLHS
jgi:hypothetical protein